MRKNVCSFVLVSLIAFLASMNAYADTVHLTGTVKSGSGIPVTVGEINGIAGPFSLTDKDNDYDFTGFCGALNINTSNEFNNLNGGGQEYNLETLKKVTIYEDIQKSSIERLFEHVYYHAFKEDGVTLNDVQVAQALQFSLWSITNDYMPPTNDSNPSLVIVASLANAFISALASDDWSTIDWKGYDFSKEVETEIVVFWTDGAQASQTIVSASYGLMGGSGDPEPTPEPATLLIFGFGAIGAGFAARRQMTK